MTDEIMEVLNGQVFGVWFLIGAALVFWMQAGFAMVETGFTRAKNAGNIIMKNLMDFCIGTVMFILIGFSLLLGEDMVGLIGKPGFDIFTAYESFDWSNFIFNLVFCATTATIVSGAMAERTKFLSYCIYSAVISALIYPIEAHVCIRHPYPGADSCGKPLCMSSQDRLEPIHRSLQRIRP